MAGFDHGFRPEATLAFTAASVLPSLSRGLCSKSLARYRPTAGPRRYSEGSLRRLGGRAADAPQDKPGIGVAAGALSLLAIRSMQHSVAAVYPSGEQLLRLPKPASGWKGKGTEKLETRVPVVALRAGPQ
ncbi:hypothetical protein UVI_02049880 [Ustilaginoidea virens]|uniref:Uncharacterized protein n=1 Tax=Ustilaginoidea virens TaxID=1159556 RepID=A0A1B5KZ15_USTVR|nr:hypothetical protein UVI_02049880 [Ustilaginoidea virens]